MMHQVVFLIDVDDTLLDGDRFISDLNSHLAQTLGTDAAAEYWKAFEALRMELGYADYCARGTTRAILKHWRIVRRRMLISRTSETCFNTICRLFLRLAEKKPEKCKHK